MILLDVAMPTLDGRDVLAQLKADPRTAAIPVLVVSALAGDQHMRDLLVDLGASDVMEKPVDLEIAFNKAERLASAPLLRLDPHSLRDHHDPALGHVEALAVLLEVVADGRVRRDLDVLVDDRAADPAVPADVHVLEQDRVLHRA